MVESIRNGLDEFLLFLEERADIRARRFLGVVDADRAHHLILLQDVCAQLPRRLFEVLGPALLSFESDLGHADFRELPSRRDGLNDTIANLIDVRVRSPSKFPRWHRDT